MNNIDFVAYVDTDSLYIRLGLFIEHNVGKENWEKLTEDDKISIIKEINDIIEHHVNDKIYRDVQRKQYNSAETEFRIKFKQEIIAKSILFVKKKKYSAWIVDTNGIPTDKIKTTGLEIVRSETPETVRPMLKDIMSMILKGSDDKELSAKISECKKELLSMPPEAISTNTGIHDTKKYIGLNNKCIKGTPMHVKGVANYRALLKLLKLENKYEDIVEGAKAKIIYLKKNQFGFDSMAFTRWPEEFDKVLQIDATRQVEKTFLNKCEMLLTVLGKTNLLSVKAKESLGLFFNATKKVDDLFDEEDEDESSF